MRWFVKLSNDVLDSSLWSEDPITRLTFLSMLVMANEHGVVEATAPGICRRANLPLDEVRKSLAILEAPDPDDKSGIDEGRRIKRVPGGYLIVNYMARREMRQEQDRREQNRIAKQRSRQRQSTSAPVSTGQHESALSAQVEVEVEGESVGSRSTISVETREQPSSASALAKVIPVEAESISWSKDACDVWISRFGGTAPGGQIGKALLPIVRRHGWDFVRKAWCRYLAQIEAQYASPQRFSATFGRWSGLTPDPPSQDDATAHNARVLADYMRGRPDGDLGGALKPMPKLRG